MISDLRMDHHARLEKKVAVGDSNFTVRKNSIKPGRPHLEKPVARDSEGTIKTVEIESFVKGKAGKIPAGNGACSMVGEVLLSKLQKEGCLRQAFLPNRRSMRRKLNRR